MDRITVDLSRGGTAVLIAPTSEYQVPDEWRLHPQVVPLTYAELAEDIHEKIPATAKILVTAERLPSPLYSALQTVVRRRTGLVHINRSTPEAVAEVLRALFKGAGKGNGELRVTKRGALQGLIARADLSKGSAEEARRLIKIAQTEGITTTLGSLAQGISVRKRKAGRGELPTSVRTPQMQALLVLDQAIDGLKLIRDYVNDTEVENAALKVQLKKISDALGMK
jgi:hypothetical protein